MSDHILSKHHKRIALWGSLASIVALILAAFVFLSGKDNICDVIGLPSSKTNDSKLFSQFSNIEYSYSGLLGLVGSPSSAKALNGKRLVAEAVVDFDGNLEPGSLKTIRVNETHYDVNGEIVYKGVIVFEASFGGYKVLDEDAIVGKRPLRVFTSWPISH
jgi:hypothetical protein